MLKHTFFAELHYYDGSKGFYHWLRLRNKSSLSNEDIEVFKRIIPLVSLGIGENSCLSFYEPDCLSLCIGKSIKQVLDFVKSNGLNIDKNSLLEIRNELKKHLEPLDEFLIT